jgi:uroporphyrinogen-III synthase
VVALTPEALRQIERGALVLIHSPRAGALFSKLVDEAGLDRSAVMIAAISEAASEAAGGGWKAAAIAAEPRDHALLELAAKLCKTKQDEMGSGG